MPGRGAALPGALAVVASALACGRLALRYLRIELGRAENVVSGFVLGSSVLSVIVFATAAHLARKGLFPACGAALLRSVFLSGHVQSRDRSPIMELWPLELRTRKILPPLP